VTTVKESHDLALQVQSLACLTRNWSFVRANPTKASVVSLSKKHIPYC